MCGRWKRNKQCARTPICCAMAVPERHCYEFPIFKRSCLDTPVRYSLLAVPSRCPAPAPSPCRSGCAAVWKCRWHVQWRTCPLRACRCLIRRCAVWPKSLARFAPCSLPLGGQQDDQRKPARETLRTLARPRSLTALPAGPGGPGSLAGWDAGAAPRHCARPRCRVPSGGEGVTGRDSGRPALNVPEFS